jgi:hypothetical protein
VIDNRLCDLVRRSYLSFIGERFHCHRSPNGHIVVVTPFISPDNDPIEVAIEWTKDGNIRLSDLGAAHEFLFLIGLEVSESDRRTALVNQITSNFDVYIERREVTVTVSESDLGSGLNRMICAEQRILDMLFTAQPGPLEKSFRVEVGEYLAQESILYLAGVKLPGYSVQHRVDFLVPDGKPRLVDALSAKNRATAEDTAIQTAFKWMDLKRNLDQYYTISLYDDSVPVWDTAIKILRNNESDRVVPWSEKERLTDELRQPLPR